MGALHAGHMAGVETLRREGADEVVLSLFVNPSQFGEGEDFDRYPRKVDDDLALCRSAGVAAVFMPSVATMYPERFQTEVRVPDLAERWEGALRPGHFAGVATVVTKLFALVQPELAAFGEKDFQQLRLVTRLAFDLGFDLRICPVPTLREADGVAMSSRNRYLSAEERLKARALSGSLAQLGQAFASGCLRVQALEAQLREALAAVAGLQTDYAVLVEPDTLAPWPLSRPVEARTRVLLAVRLGSTRLIDNCALGEPPSAQSHGI